MHRVWGRCLTPSLAALAAQVLSARELDNFPLVNVTHPDLARHPLFADAHVFEVELWATHGALPRRAHFH